MVLARYLRDAGYDVLAVAELAPRATDRNILGWAADERRIVISCDKDFGELVFRSGQTHEGVILLRLRDESAANQLRVLSNALTLYAKELPGQFAVVTERRVRIRSFEAQD
jgi:predicted nuclease of predicted toxin-antitoxin system